jgi:hypothetical protein
MRSDTGIDEHRSSVEGSSAVELIKLFMYETV